MFGGVDTVYEIGCGEIKIADHPRRAFDGEAVARLAEGIRQYGILQPLTVRRSQLGDNRFELVAGERRLRAAVTVGLEKVPCLILDSDGLRSAELSIIENIQRENLNMFEQAASLAELIYIYKYTQEQIARRLSSSQSYVANKLRLLRFDSNERAAIVHGKLTERHARALLRLNGEERSKAIEYVVRENLNVSQTEAYVEKLLCAEDCSPETEQRGRRKFVFKDMRIFYNTINRAVEMMAAAGVDVLKLRRETSDAVEILLRIPK